MRSQTGLLTAGRMLLCGDDLLIRLPEIRVAMRLAISCGDARPEFLASRFAAIPNHVGDDLPRVTAQGDPNPTFVDFFQHK